MFGCVGWDLECGWVDADWVFILSHTHFGVYVQHLPFRRKYMTTLEYYIDRPKNYCKYTLHIKTLN